MEKRIFLSILAIYALLSAELFAQTDSTGYEGTPEHRLQRSLYSIYRTEKAEIVMLGNSRIHGVNWNELLGRDDIAERGIPGDVLRDFLGRMNDVYRLKPKLCFIMGGVNDIYTGYPPELILSNYKKVIKGLIDHNITPVIQSALYVARKWPQASVRNPEIHILNNLLRSYAEKNNIPFIDLNLRMSTGEALRNELTFDGIHLNAQGYAIWRNEIEGVINSLLGSSLLESSN